MQVKVCNLPVNSQISNSISQKRMVLWETICMISQKAQSSTEKCQTGLGKKRKTTESVRQKGHFNKLFTHLRDFRL